MHGAQAEFDNLVQQGVSVDSMETYLAIIEHRVVQVWEPQEAIEMRVQKGCAWCARNGEACSIAPPPLPPSFQPGPPQPLASS